MLIQLPKMTIPQWLTDVSDSTIMDPFPLEHVLKDSLYYPASGFDGTPVKYLAGNIFSFIYVDYGSDHDEFMNALGSPGFRGYNRIATRSVTEKELTPKGWHPMPPTHSDGDPSRYHMKRSDKYQNIIRDYIKKPFCSWSIFQRSENFTSDHGPSRFSLLYLCADGVAAFQALYVTNSIAPKAVAVISPGTGFGLNWTDFEDPYGILARSVLGNPAGPPEILLYGGTVCRGHQCHQFYRTPCWPDYQENLCFIRCGTVGVWCEHPTMDYEKAQYLMDRFLKSYALDCKNLGISLASGKQQN